MLQAICKSTKALIFVGIPHRGSELASIAETITRVVAAVGFDTNHRTIRTIQFDSIELELSREEFIKQWGDGYFEVRSSQEAIGVKGMQGLSAKVVWRSCIAEDVADAVDRWCLISRPHLMTPESAHSTLMRTIWNVLRTGLWRTASAHSRNREEARRPTKAGRKSASHRPSLGVKLSRLK